VAVRRAPFPKQAASSRQDARLTRSQRNPDARKKAADDPAQDLRAYDRPPARCGRKRERHAGGWAPKELSARVALGRNRFRQERDDECALDDERPVARGRLAG
jgi:hypothetical protein